MLGSGVDPRSFRYDFSGAYKIGENYAKGIESLGQSIAGTIDAYKETKKENAVLTGQIKGIEKKIDSAITLFPERGPELEQAKISINDPSRSLIERASEAKTYEDLIQNSLTMMKARASLNMQDARLNKMTGGSGGGSSSGGRSSGGGGASTGGSAAPSGTGWNSGGFSVQ